MSVRSILLPEQCQETAVAVSRYRQLSGSGLSHCVGSYTVQLVVPTLPGL